MNDYWNHSSTHLDIGSYPPTDYTHFDYRVGTQEAVEVVEAQQFGLFHEGAATIKLLSTLKENEAPFFLYLASQSAHTPNEAPSEYAALYDYAPFTARQMKQAQMTILDENVGEMVDFLKNNGLWDNTLMVFSSDNGADYNRGDNSPLRGYKNTSFDGGLRVPGFVTGGYLAEDRRGTVN